MATGAKVTTFLDDRRKALALTFGRLLDYEFAVLEEHRRQMDASLRKAIQDMDARWIAARDKVKFNSDQHIDFTEEYFETSELLPRLQWASQLVLTYATFEHSLNQLCLTAKTRMGYPLTVAEFNQQQTKRDNGIVLAKRYLGKVAGIRKPFDTESWGFALKINKLRNVLVHSNGEFYDPPTDKQEEVRLLFKDDPRLRVVLNLDGKPQRFRVTPELVHGAIHAMAQVVKDVCEAEPSTKTPI